MSTEFRICGMFDDQKGIVRKGKIVGYNGEGVPVRRYIWVQPKIKRLKGKSFEAFDDQIANARKGCR